MNSFIQTQLAQIKDNSRTITLIYLPSLLIFVLMAFQPVVKISDLTRDTVALANVPIYTGIVSDVSIYFWFATVTICFFITFILSKMPDKSDECRFLTLMGLFTLFLAIDDRMMIHDHYISGGEVIYVLYVLFSGYMVWRFNQLIFKGPSFWLWIGLGFLGLSIGIDSVKDLLRLFEFEGIYDTIGNFVGLSGETVFQQAYLLEDAAKLLGIIGWFLYFCHFSYDQIRGMLSVPTYDTSD